ncbi:MAG: [protein-PII] uridylyltransferase, partial [Gammaproteobacteria bacterium]|nr:[protein-PII] uridylyltransferase [Gammaproteobacteria bacterium]
EQGELARLFGYEDDDKSLGVEKLMQCYYQAVGNLRTLNDMLLQHLDEAILRAGERVTIKFLNDHFQINNDYIEAIDDRVFIIHPSALLEVFVLMGQNPTIKGIRASTIRLLHENRHLINDQFRHDQHNCDLFIQLLRTPHEMTLQLRRMARYGILGRYLPEFGKVTGQMQHDLFHIYTVDAHTLQVVENLRRFRLPEAEAQFPIAAANLRKLPKLELLYIAGLYHDIAKGRGGDHSELGMVDAENFCRRHGLSEWDTSLVVWLVENHLLMSMVAQRKDISDPEVIREFGELMGDRLHLDYLYTLTVADICATNPDLWNSWRASLMSQLYHNTCRALNQGLERTVNRDARIADSRDTALQQLLTLGLEYSAIEAVWENTAEEYFIRESISEIVWHTEAIARVKGDGPLISFREIESGSTIQGATQVFLYTKDADFLFANSTAAFEKLRLNIVSARLFTSVNGYCMDTYTVLEANGKPVGNNRIRLNEIQKVLREQIDGSHRPAKPVSLRLDRKRHYFNKPIETAFLNTEDKPYSALELNCPDHPGILACVGKVFAKNRIQLRDARIATLGERIEDLFLITDADGEPILDPQLRQSLQLDIKYELESRLNL